MVRLLAEQGAEAAAAVGIYGGCVSAAFTDPVGDEDIAMLFKLSGQPIGRVWRWHGTKKWNGQSAFTGKCRSDRSIRKVARFLIDEYQNRHK